MHLADTHCHLDHPKFDPDRAEVLARARQAGVERILIPGVSLDSSRAAARIAAAGGGLHAAVGVHPTELAGWEPGSVAELEQLGRLQQVVAVGEIGLDYYWEAAPHELQRSALEAQLELASRLGLPVVVHLREKGDAERGPCFTDGLQVLAAWTEGLRQAGHPLAARPGVLHSFSGDRPGAELAIELGFRIGVTGPVTYRAGRQALFAVLPLEDLLLETDAPFLAPLPQRGGRNEPAWVRWIADKIAEIHQVNVEEVGRITSGNASRLFQWEEPL